MRADLLLQDLVEETQPPESWRRGVDGIPAARAVLAAPPETAGAVLELGARLWAMWPESFRIVFRGLIRRLLRRRGQGEALGLAQLIPLTEMAGRFDSPVPLDALVGAIERAVSAGQALSDADRSSLRALGEALAGEDSAYMIALRDRIEKLLNPAAAEDAGAPLPEAVIAHARSLRGSKPSAKWLAAARALVPQISPRSLARALAREDRGAPTPLDRGEAALLGGLVWIASAIDDAALIGAIGQLAESSLRKVVGYGPVSARVAHACIEVLARIARPEAIAALIRLRDRARYFVARRLIDRALAAFAERSGSTIEDLEETSVPSFGLRDGSISQELDGHVAELRIDNAGRASIEWWAPDGELLGGSVPAALLRDHRGEVEAVRRTARELRRTLTRERHRLERIESFERELPFDRWVARYLQHPLLKTVARRLIWEHLDEEASRAIAVESHTEKLVDLQGRPFSSRDDARVRLWHPIRASGEELARCRAFVSAHRIAQPFPQAYRPTFRPTAEEAARAESDRFARTIVYQHQLAAVLRQRGWRYALLGAGFASGDAAAATLELRAFELVAELELIAVQDPRQMSSAGAWMLCATRGLRFRAASDRRALPLGEVPLLVFSEVAREIALILTAAAIEELQLAELREALGA